MLLKYCPELQIEPGANNSQRWLKQCLPRLPNPAVAPPSPSSFFPPQPLLIQGCFTRALSSLQFSSSSSLPSLVTLTGISSHLPVFDNSNDFISRSKLSLVEMSVYSGNIVVTYDRTRIFGSVDWQLGVLCGILLVGIFNAVRLVCGRSTRDIPSI